jgi:hypothetical protein
LEYRFALIFQGFFKDIIDILLGWLLMSSVGGATRNEIVHAMAKVFIAVL